MMNFTETAQRTSSIIKYAYELRLHHPSLSTDEVFQIAEDMHKRADTYGEQALKFQAELNVNDIVICIDAESRDVPFAEDEKLTEGQEYRVLEVTSRGMVVVDHPITGRVGRAFYADRFKLVKQTQVEGSSTEINN